MFTTLYNIIYWYSRKVNCLEENISLGNSWCWTKTTDWFIRSKMFWWRIKSSTSKSLVSRFHIDMSKSINQEQIIIIRSVLCRRFSLFIWSLKISNLSLSLVEEVNTVSWQRERTNQIRLSSSLLFLGIHIFFKSSLLFWLHLVCLEKYLIA